MSDTFDSIWSCWARLNKMSTESALAELEHFGKIRKHLMALPQRPPGAPVVIPILFTHPIRDAHPRLEGDDPVVCSSCGKPMVWVQLKSGKSMPCDPAILTVVTSDGEIAKGRTSHFATCPHANKHRKPKEEDARDATARRSD